MNCLNEIIEYFDDNIKSIFISIDEIILNKITEIRIRKNKPFVIVIRNTSYFIDYNGDIYDYPTHNAVKIDSTSFDELFLKLCDYSIYSYSEDMKKGFITLKSGVRIGLTGTYVECDDISTVKDITGLNIRIHRKIFNCADKLLNSLYINSFPSIIVAGPPNSGKTTLLRDIAYQLSDGFNNHYSKIAIIDERNEIAGKVNDEYSVEIGANCDVLTGFPKAKGIEIATRTLSPDMIICDEIATLQEVKSIEFAFSSGIAFALSVHLADRQNIFDKPVIRELISTNEFSYIVLFSNHTYEYQIIDIGELLNEMGRNNSNYNFLNRYWNDSLV